VFAQVREEARALGRECVDTEHVLLEVCYQDEGDSDPVLAPAGITAKSVKAWLAHHGDRGVGATDRSLPFTALTSSRRGLPGHHPQRLTYLYVTRSDTSGRRKQPQRRLDRMDIVRIASDHRMASIAGAQRDRNVGNVRHPGDRTPRAHSQGQPLIERYDRSNRSAEQPRDARLAGTTPPRLSDNTGWDSQFGPGGQCLFDQDRHAPASRLQRDQRPGVQGRAGHRESPSACRAQARSASVGSPVSA